MQRLQIWKPFPIFPIKIYRLYLVVSKLLIVVPSTEVNFIKICQGDAL